MYTIIKRSSGSFFDPIRIDYENIDDAYDHIAEWIEDYKENGFNVESIGHNFYEAFKDTVASNYTIRLIYVED